MSINFGQVGFGNGRSGEGIDMSAQTISVVDAGQLDDTEFQNLISGMDARRSPFWLLLVALTLATVILAGCGKSTSASGGPTATATETEQAEPTATEDDQPQVYSPEEISQMLAPSTVMVIAEGDGWAMSGTGFIYDDSGLIITNTHVIEGAASVKVYFAGSPRMYPAHIIGRSTCDDISVIQINADDLQEVALGDSDALAVGQEVMALGYPLASGLGEEISLTRGIVSRLNVDAGIWDNAIQVDAAINPGNSGGPLVNAHGEVVGVNSAGYNGSVAQDMNYAVSINHALAVAELLEVEGDHNWLGLELIPNSAELAAEYGLPTEQGMVVTFVAPGGPADELGLQAGDVILKMQGATIYSMDQVCNIVRTHSLENVRLDVVEYGSTDAAADDTGQGAGDEQADDDQTADDGDDDQAQDDQDANDDQNTDDGQGGDDNQNDDGNQNDDDQAQDGGAGDGQTGASFRDDLNQFLVTNGFELLASADFANGDPGDFWTGDDGNGGRMSVTEDGWYLFELGADTLQYVYPDSAASLADGAFVTDVYFVPGEGTAAAGILARLNDSGQFYYCMLTSLGETGCYFYTGSEWQTISTTEAGEIAVSEVNTLALMAVGSEFFFEVNGQKAGGFSDSNLASGAWGVVADCWDSSCAISFDYADIYSVASAGNGNQTDGQQDEAADDSASDGSAEFEYLYQSDFESGDAGPWFTGEGEGYSFGVNGGWYVMSLDDGYYLANVAGELGDIQDAAISVDFGMEGNGVFGLVGRYALAGDQETYYLCWITPTGDAGCSLMINGEWQTLIQAESPVHLAEANRLTLAMVGDTLSFAINGQEVGTATDSALAAGQWGMYLMADGGQMNAYVGYVEIITLTT